MNPEKQRIKIAEACEWEGFYTTKPFGELGENVTYGWHEVLHPHDKHSHPIPLPDYLNDLNAMYEAENSLDDEDRQVFANKLSQIHDASYKQAWWDLDSRETFIVAHSTARQRAEAFLKTLGLWGDGE